METVFLIGGLFVQPTGKTVKISPLTNQPNESIDFNYIARSRPIIG